MVTICSLRGRILLVYEQTNPVPDVRISLQVYFDSAVTVPREKSYDDFSQLLFDTYDELNAIPMLSSAGITDYSDRISYLYFISSSPGPKQRARELAAVLVSNLIEAQHISEFPTDLFASAVREVIKLRGKGEEGACGVHLFYIILCRAIVYLPTTDLRFQLGYPVLLRPMIEV